MKRILFFMLVALVFQTANAQQKACKATITNKTKLQYLLFVPQNAEKSTGKLPLILFLHGSGESGSDISKLKVHGLPKYVETHPDFQAIVVSPQCPDSREGWNRFALRGLILKLCAKLPVDTNRVYITGLSMGGRGTWDMLTYYPELFAAAVPVCGWGDSRLIRRAKNVPVRIYHGANDDVVSLSYSIEMYEAMKKMGANVELTIYPDTKHDSWTKTYNDSTMYQWLFKQSKLKQSKKERID